MIISEAELADIEAKAKAVDDRPLELREECGYFDGSDGTQWHIGRPGMLGYYAMSWSAEPMRLLLAARLAIPRLVQRIRELEAELQALEQRIDEEYASGQRTP